jgi:hypothetical protein
MVARGREDRFHHKPTSIIGLAKNCRHPVVDLSQEIVGRHGKNGKGALPLSRRRFFPIFPDTRDPKWRAVSRRDNAFQVPDYAKHFTCISLDLRSAGETDKPEGTYSNKIYSGMAEKTGGGAKDYPILGSGDFP